MVRIHITVAHEQIAAFDELDAHLLGEEHMLEIGAVVTAGRE